MLTWVLRRLAASLVLVIVISAITFVLLSIPDTDVGRALLGQGAAQELVDAKNEELGLSRPVAVRYLEWLAGAARGDLGTSWFTGESVSDAIATRIPVTLSLMLSVTGVTAIIAFSLGVWAAVKRGWVDRAVQILGVAGYALPGFLVTLILVLVFAVQLRLFPAVGYTDISVSPSGWLSTITLPVIALSIASIAGVSQQVRGSVIDVLEQDYIRTLHARGLSKRRVLFRHALRNASAPAITVLGLQFVGLLGGAVLVEQIFGLPGIGSMTVAYTTRGDIPIIMGLVMFTVLGVVVINLIVDFVVGWLNPKVRTK